MKQLITILLCLFTLFAEAQVNTNDTNKYFKSYDYGFSYKRLQAREAFIMPTDTVINKLGAVSLNGVIYLGNGIKWTSIGGGIDTTNQFVKRLTRTPGKDSIIYFVGANRFAIKDSVGTLIDTTSLSNRINKKIDSLKRSSDSVYAFINGVKTFQFKDSVGTTPIPTLQQVTTAGATTTNTITVNSLNLTGASNPITLNGNGDQSFAVVRTGTSDELFSVNDGVNGYLKFGGGAGQFVEILTNANGNVSLQAPSTNGTIALTSDTTNKFVNRLTRTSGKDSIIYFVGANRFAIKDSVGNTSGFVPYTGATQNVNLGTKNITANSYFNGFTSMFAKNDTIVLTIDSTPVHLVKGSGGQGFKLPIATTLINGTIFSFNNNQSSGVINVLSNSIANTLVKSVPSGAYLTLELTDNTTATGTWDAHFQTPSNVSWSTNTLDYNGSITSAQWNGTTVTYNRGGTGQSSNFTQGGVVYGSSTTAMATTSAGTSGQILTSNGTSAPTWTNKSDTTKLNISDSASMLSKYLRKIDTASLSNRIDKEVSNLDLLQLMSYGIKAESYGITLANMSGQQALTTNRFYLYPFNWNVSDTIRGISWFNRAAFTNVATNYNGIAIYSLSGSTLNRVLFTANDGTFWNSTINTWSSKSITPTFLTKGLYFIGYQFSGAGTPTMGSGDPLVIASTQSPSDPPSAVNSNGIKFSTFIANTTATPPSSIAMSTTTAVVNVPYFMFY